VTRAEVREFCHVLNISQEHADRFFDMLDMDRNGVIDFQEVAAIIGPHIQPGYQAPVHYKRAAIARERLCEAPSAQRSAPPPRATHGDQERQDFDQIVDLIGSKASQKYRTVTDCFRFLDESKTGHISRDKCRRFVEELGFNPSIGDSLFRYLAGNHQQVDFLKFSETFGPYIQPGYSSAQGVRRASLGGSKQTHRKWPVGRAATPPPYRVSVDRQAHSGRQRPQSARLAGRGSRSRAAADVHAAAEWQGKVAHSGSSAGSTCSRSTCSASTASAARSTCSSVEEAEPDRHGHHRPPCRAEVSDQHIGSYMYMPETPRAVNNATWDSSQVKNRMTMCPASAPSHLGRSTAHPPQPPSAPRPHTAGGRYRRHRPREDVEAYEDNLSERGSYYETSVCGSPHESRHSPAQAQYHKDHSGALIRTEQPHTPSIGGLHSALEKRWSVL